MLPNITCSPTSRVTHPTVITDREIDCYDLTKQNIFRVSKFVNKVPKSCEICLFIFSENPEVISIAVGLSCCLVVILSCSKNVPMSTPVIIRRAARCKSYLQRICKLVPTCMYNAVKTPSTFYLMTTVTGSTSLLRLSMVGQLTVLGRLFQSRMVSEKQYLW